MRSFTRKARGWTIKVDFDPTGDEHLVLLKRGAKEILGTVTLDMGGGVREVEWSDKLPKALEDEALKTVTNAYDIYATGSARQRSREVSPSWAPPPRDAPGLPGRQYASTEARAKVIAALRAAADVLDPEGAQVHAAMSQSEANKYLREHDKCPPGYVKQDGKCVPKDKADREKGKADKPAKDEGDKKADKPKSKVKPPSQAPTIVGDLKPDDKVALRKWVNEVRKWHQSLDQKDKDVQDWLHDLTDSLDSGKTPWKGVRQERDELRKAIMKVRKGA